MPLRREERVGGDGGGAEHGAETSTPAGNGLAGRGLGGGGEGNLHGWVHGCKQHGCGASRWCPPSWATTTAPSRSTSGVARYRDHAAFGCILTRKRARHAQQQNDVQVTRTLEHLCPVDAVLTAGRMARAEGRPRAWWVWVRSGWYLCAHPHVQSHGKCALCVYVRIRPAVGCAFKRSMRCVAETLGGLYVWRNSASTVLVLVQGGDLSATHTSSVLSRCRTTRPQPLYQFSPAPRPRATVKHTHVEHTRFYMYSNASTCTRTGASDDAHPPRR